jgi:hypothetical protein
MLIFFLASCRLVLLFMIDCEALQRDMKYKGTQVAWRLLLQRHNAEAENKPS